MKRYAIVPMTPELIYDTLIDHWADPPPSVRFVAADYDFGIDAILIKVSSPSFDEVPEACPIPRLSPMMKKRISCRCWWCRLSRWFLGL